MRVCRGYPCLCPRLALRISRGIRGPGCACRLLPLLHLLLGPVQALRVMQRLQSPPCVILQRCLHFSAPMWLSPRLCLSCTLQLCLILILSLSLSLSRGLSWGRDQGRGLKSGLAACARASPCLSQSCLSLSVLLLRLDKGLHDGPA